MEGKEVGFVKERFAWLHHIRGKEPITPQSHPEFLCQLQQGLLLALQEQKIISSEVCRKAEERLPGARQEDK